MCGTSVSGPLNSVRDDSFPGMYRSDNHATLALPGASYAASTVGRPSMATPLPSDHDSEGLGAKSGMPCRISRIVADCDESKAVSGSLLPEPNEVLDGADIIC